MRTLREKKRFGKKFSNDLFKFQFHQPFGEIEQMSHQMEFGVKDDEIHQQKCTQLYLQTQLRR